VLGQRSDGCTHSSVRHSAYVELIMLGGWYRLYMWCFVCLEYETGGVYGVNYVWRMRLAMCMWSYLCLEDEIGGICGINYVWMMSLAVCM